MAQINGIAERYDGAPVDYVSIFNWADGKCIAQVIPSITGEWSYQYYADLKVGITYVSDGCEPLTHGAYEFIYASETPTDGLVLHYPFNGDAIDLSISKINGATYQSPTFEVGRNERLCANTSNGGFYTASSVPFGTKQATISMWLNMKGNTNFQCILETVSKSLAVWFNDLQESHIEITSKASKNNNLHARTARVAGLNEWNHFVFTVDRELDASNAAHLYVNNIDITSTAGVGGNNTITNEIFLNDVISIGLRHNDSNFRFNGLIQDMRIYNRILTPEDRLALLNE